MTLGRRGADRGTGRARRRHVFGIPGVHTLELYRGLTTSGIRHVTPRHEQGAGFMADGWCRVTGRPGVCLVISGPGVTNVLTPIAQARQDARPLLVVSASVSRDAARPRAWRHPRSARPARRSRGRSTRLTVSIDEPDELGPALDAAWAVLEGRLRPARPGAPAGAGRRAAAQPPRPRLAPLLPRSAQRCLRRTRSSARPPLLAGATRPAMILGGGARDAGPAALAVAERLGAPVGLTINGKGAVPPSDPLCVPSRMMVAPFDACSSTPTWCSRSGRSSPSSTGGRSTGRSHRSDA